MSGFQYGVSGEVTMYRDDLATLFGVTECKVLETLEARYAQANIYTYIGDILILVNPFNTCLLYGPEVTHSIIF